MSIVILAEKPSQGAAYAEAFSSVRRKDGYIEVNDHRFFHEKAYITWGFGHLVELVEPEQYKEEWKEWSLRHLPIIPEQFKFQVSTEKRKQFNIVKKLLLASSEIIVATDCDREGENIARSIIYMAGASRKPTKRLWINSLEVDEIQKGFRELKDGNGYLSLYKEAQTRQFSDWLVGINASRLYTLLLQQKGLRGVFSVGRVQTPTLYLIYQRQKQIENFQSKPFYEWFGNVNVKNGQFVAKHKEKFDTKEDAFAILEKYGVKEGENRGFISRIEKVQKKTKSPKLHSLSTLQARANKLWKYSPSEVLKITQGLYEKKLITYPRTDTHYITENEFAYLKERLTSYQACMNVEFAVAYPDPQKRFVDGQKVQEHYALIPTKQVTNLSKLSDKERNIYQEIMLTTLAMFAADYEYEETKVEVNVNGFILEKTGKVERKIGWKALFKQEDKTKEKKDEEVSLPKMIEGETCSIYLKMKEGMTQPPKPYTEGQLIQVMKQAGKEIEDEEAKEILKTTEGIGTEATRAAIIETLKAQKYIEVKNNVVSVTQKGIILCEAVAGTLLSSPEMTAKWEQYLRRIGKNEGSQEHFLKSIIQFIEKLLQEAHKGIERLNKEIEKIEQQTNFGSCPSCNVGKILDKGKFYGCSRYRDGCTFTLPKIFLGKTISETNIKKLLNGEKTNLIKGFKGIKGKFDAYLRLEKGTGKLKLEFKIR